METEIALALPSNLELTIRHPQTQQSRSTAVRIVDEKTARKTPTMVDGKAESRSTPNRGTGSWRSWTLAWRPLFTIRAEEL